MGDCGSNDDEGDDDNDDAIDDKQQQQQDDGDVMYVRLCRGPCVGIYTHIYI